MNITGEIRWHLGDGVEAKLRYSESTGAISVDAVFVPAANRGMGIGSELLNRVLLLADHLEKEVHLTARPMGAVTSESRERLVKYYQRFGFEVTDRGQTCAYMTRLPACQTTP